MAFVSTSRKTETSEQAQPSNVANQLYARVAADGDVQLTPDHPGFADPAYRARRNELASLSIGWTPGMPIPAPVYTAEENEIWAVVWRELTALLPEFAGSCILESLSALPLPTSRVPQLPEVTVALQPLTGFSYGVVPGLASLCDFYGSLADDLFLSTQYLRHPSVPLYTPEPDIIHEVVGHALSLGVPELADICRSMGRAVQRVESPEALAALSRIFWFSIEFGCIWEDNELRTYGAGIVSSFGELQEFRNAEIRPLDLRQMATQTYDITHYQPVLFAGRGLAEVVDVVGAFFDHADDDRVLSLLAS